MMSVGEGWGELLVKKVLFMQARGPEFVFRTYIKKKKRHDCVYL